MALPSARGIASDILLCLSFFTRLPLPTYDMPSRGFGSALWAAPVAGAVVGLLSAAIFALTLSIGLPATVAAALTVVAALLATGCLHEDGLADVADGFGGGPTRERKLEIMRDSRTGAYGVAAVACSILLRWTAIAALPSPGTAALALVAAHAASRAIIPAFMHVVPNARADGLSAGAGDVAQGTAFIALGLGALALLFAGPDVLLISALVLGAWLLGLRKLTLRQIGGRTGDVLGTLQQGGEIIVLLCALSLL